MRKQTKAFLLSLLVILLYEGVFVLCIGLWSSNKGYALVSLFLWIIPTLLHKKAFNLAKEGDSKLIYVFVGGIAPLIVAGLILFTIFLLPSLLANF